MRFTFWPAATHSWENILELARHIETTGWDGLVYADHFMANAEDTRGPCGEAWTTVAAILASVPRIRVGTLVAGNTYRHPAVLAKMAATLDHISAGRLVLGLGAGWQENEHRAYGIPFYSVGERLARLDEACQLIKSLFANEKSDFDGKYYQLADAPLFPKPIQSPLPLLIGGGGEKVTLKIAARYADEWNVWGDVDRLRDKMAILDRHCDAVGRDPNQIDRSAVALLFLSDDEAFLKRIREADVERPMIVGGVDEVRDTIGAYAEAGVNEIIIPDFNLGDPARSKPLLDRFIEEVASSFR